MVEESDEQFTDRIIRESHALADRMTVGSEVASLKADSGWTVWSQLTDPEVIASLTPDELKRVSAILAGALERNRRRGR